MVDYALSREIGFDIQAENGMCWNNAIEAMLTNPDLVYVEGWATAHGFLVCEHGWCVTKDGTVVDPTPAWNEASFPNQYERQYFPIQSITYDRLAEMMECEGEITPPFYRDGKPFTDFSQPEVRKAYRKACRQCYGEEMATMFLGQLNQAYPDDDDV